MTNGSWKPMNKCAYLLSLGQTIPIVLSIWFPKRSLVGWSPTRVLYSGDWLDKYSWIGFFSSPLHFPHPPISISWDHLHARLCLTSACGGNLSYDIKGFQIFYDYKRILLYSFIYFHVTMCKLFSRV